MMVLMAELLEGWGDLSCFGHTLQPAVTAGVALNTIARLAAVCHKIAGTSSSAVVMVALTERQRSLKDTAFSGVLPHGEIPLASCTSTLQNREWPSNYAVLRDDQVTPSGKQVESCLIGVKQLRQRKGILEKTKGIM